jgi:hypothetical protein
MANTLGDGSRRFFSDFFDAVLGLCEIVVSLRLARESARRRAARGHGSFRWMTEDDAIVADALAKLMIPADEDSPGIEDVCILGPSAIEVLDRLVAGSPERQRLYERGLAAFDLWAERECGRRFASVPPEGQMQLLKASQRIHEEWTSHAPLAAKAWRRFKIVISGAGVPHGAGLLFPQFRSDCFQVFYTSRVSWVWLDYDGPPMDEGYPKLAPRHGPRGGM